MNEQGSRAEKPPAVILFSGGLDSTTTAGIALQQGFLLHALTFHYGQRHAREVDAASALVRELGIGSHRVARLDLANRGGSALTDPGRGIPRGRSEEEIATGGIPETYVPARNTIFLSHALAWCEVLGAEDVFIGVNVLDYSGYPDCRPEYLRAFEQLARLATRAGTEGGRQFHIHAPLLTKTKGEIIRWGLELGIDYGKTWSCYDPTPEGLPCGTCDSCILRQKGFREAGVEDPAK